ncbi:MAG: hypothetical protein JWO81_1155 [Alphaproteobacteria bacterium]|nr:hypothetical protein [Alphaproteobacteria bacterium]
MKLAVRTGIFAISTALLITPASAARWRFISGNRDPQLIVFGDENSIRADGRHRKRIRVETVAPAGPGVVDQVELVEFDCTARQERNLSLIGRDLHGRVIVTDHATAWKSVSPDTVGGAEMRAACHGFPSQAFTVDSPVVDGRGLLSEVPPQK